MAEIESPGFCTEKCEIDTYRESADELALMSEVALVDPFPDLDHEQRLKAMRVVGDYHGELFQKCVEAAVTRPCEGRLKDGVVMRGFPKDNNKVFCPVVVSQLLGLVE